MVEQNLGELLFHNQARCRVYVGQLDTSLIQIPVQIEVYLSNQYLENRKYKQGLNELVCFIFDMRND